MWRYACFFVWQFPSHSYWFSDSSLTLLCTRIWVRLYGIKEVGGLEGLGFVEKIRNFKAIHDCRFHHLLALFLAFEKSRIVLHFYWHLIFISFLSFAAFWKMLITILFGESKFLMNESVKFSSFENGFKIPLVCFQNESVHRIKRVMIFPYFPFQFCPKIFGLRIRHCFSCFNAEINGIS